MQVRRELRRSVLIAAALLGSTGMTASRAAPSADAVPAWEIVAQHVDQSLGDVTGLDLVSAARPGPRAVTRRRPRSGDWDFDPVFSPSGTRVAFSRNYARREGLYVVAVRGGKARRLSPPVDGRAAWSPDGTRIAFSRGWGGEHGGLYVVRLKDGHVTRLLKGGGFATWSPDGGELVCSCGRQLAIWVIDARGRGARRLTANIGVDSGASWSPDGRLIAYGRNCRANGLNDVWCDVAIMNADGSNKRIVAPKTQFEAGFPPLWSGPHTLLVPTWQKGSGIVSVDVMSGTETTFYTEPGIPYASRTLTRFAVFSYPTELALLDAGGHVLGRTKTQISPLADRDVYVGP